MLVLQGVPPLGDVKQGGVGKTSYFEAKCVNISKTVEIRPKLLLMTITITAFMLCCFVRIQ